jgi:outer membrane biosynthesis protein TonB
MSQRSLWGAIMIRKLLASKKALIVAAVLAVGVAIAVPTTVFAATTQGGLLAAFTGVVPSAAPEERDEVKAGGTVDIADVPVKPTPSPTPEPTKEPEAPPAEPKAEPSQEPKTTPTEEPKSTPAPKPTPDPAYQFEDPAVARAAFDAHRSGSGLPAFATYNGNDCTKVGYASTKAPAGTAPSSVIIAESGGLVLTAAAEGRLTTAKVNGWYDDSGRWRVDLAVYDCAA